MTLPQNVNATPAALRRRLLHQQAAKALTSCMRDTCEPCVHPKPTDCNACPFSLAQALLPDLIASISQLEHLYSQYLSGRQAALNHRDAQEPPCPAEP